MENFKEYDPAAIDRALERAEKINIRGLFRQAYPDDGAERYQRFHRRRNAKTTPTPFDEFSKITELRPDFLRLLNEEQAAENENATRERKGHAKSNYAAIMEKLEYLQKVIESRNTRQMQVA